MTNLSDTNDDAHKTKPLAKRKVRKVASKKSPRNDTDVKSTEERKSLSKTKKSTIAKSSSRTKLGNAHDQSSSSESSGTSHDSSIRLLNGSKHGSADKFGEEASFLLIPIPTLNDPPSKRIKAGKRGNSSPEISLEFTMEDLEQLEAATKDDVGGNDDLLEKLQQRLLRDAEAGGSSTDKSKGKKRSITGKHSAQLLVARKELASYHKEHGMDDTKHLTLKEQILLMNVDVSVKSQILRKMDDFDVSRTGYDQSKFNNWVKDVLQIPFKKAKKLPITLENSAKEISNYLDTVKEKLDAAIYGQDAAKEEIVDYIARLISNPTSKGSILALTGERGTGKTRLVRKGIAAALQRPFHVINLGGMNDVHLLSGHDLTYTGAKYGRLSQILIQSQCENPVVYLDELDKVQSGSDKGMEIFRVLTHILDSEQNHEFFDEYFSNVKLDLSKILFVASLNEIESIEPILRDRLKLISIKDLDATAKLNISDKYMIPELCQEMAFPRETIDIPEATIRHIIGKTEEPGCRNLKRKWETILQKLNTQRITESGMFSIGKKPIVITSSVADDLLKSFDCNENNFPMHMYQ